MRSMSCLRLHSRASVPTAPRKYLVVTMVEALTDQKSGYSTPRCSKTVTPVFQLVCTTSRRSHVSSSYGCTPAVLKTRSIVRPAPVLPDCAALAPPLTVSVIPLVSRLSRLLLRSLLVAPTVLSDLGADVGGPGARSFPTAHAGPSGVSPSGRAEGCRPPDAPLGASRSRPR